MALHGAAAGSELGCPRATLSTSKGSGWVFSLESHPENAFFLWIFVKES